MNRRGPMVLLNDRLVPAARARISALDRGFVYGDGLFETVRVYAGAPYGLAAHLQRLARSARVFRIPFEPTVSHWLPRMRRCLRASPRPHTIMRHSVRRWRHNAVARWRRALGSHEAGQLRNNVRAKVVVLGTQGGGRV